MGSALAGLGYFPQPRPEFCGRTPMRHRFYARTRHKIEYAHPISNVATQDLSLPEWFDSRADRWERETGIHSSPVIRFMHKDYQSIMARGKDVIPHILNRMKKKPDDWFWALRHLADDHDAAAGADSFEGAVSAWLKWGVDNGYISE